MVSSFNYLLALGGAAFAPETGAGRKAPTSTILKFGNLELDTKWRVLRIYQVKNDAIDIDQLPTTIDLADRPISILEYLFIKKDKAASREEIIENCKFDEDVSDRAIDTIFAKLAKKIVVAGCGQRVISSVIGVGYKLDPEYTSKNERRELTSAGIIAGDFSFLPLRGELYFRNHPRAHVVRECSDFLHRLMRSDGKLIRFSASDFDARSQAKRARIAIGAATKTAIDYIETVRGMGYVFRSGGTSRQAKLVRNRMRTNEVSL